MYTETSKQTKICSLTILIKIYTQAVLPKKIWIRWNNTKNKRRCICIAAERLES